MQQHTHVQVARVCTITNVRYHAVICQLVTSHSWRPLRRHSRRGHTSTHHPWWHTRGRHSTCKLDSWTVSQGYIVTYVTLYKTLPGGGPGTGGIPAGGRLYVCGPAATVKPQKSLIHYSSSTVFSPKQAPFENNPPPLFDLQVLAQVCQERGPPSEASSL